MRSPKSFPDAPEMPHHFVEGLSRSLRTSRQRRSAARWFAAVALFVLAAACDSSLAAGRVFFDDFEAYPVGTLPTGQWEADAPHTLPSVVNTAFDKTHGPRSGTKMMQTNWNGDAYSGAKVASWSYNREFLIRYWVRFDADVDRKDGCKAFRLTNGVGESYYWCGLMADNTSIISYWEEIDGVSDGGNGRLYWDFEHLIGNGAWHKFELYVKHNQIGQRDGVLRIWVDGKLVHEVINQKTVGDGRKWFPMYVNSNWSMNPGWEHDSNNHVYWDDFEIYSDTGSGATGSMSDATICAGPSCKLPAPNLRLIQ